MPVANEPFTFRPPVRRQGLRTGLGIFLSLLAVGGGLFGVAVVAMPRILEYQVRDGALSVTTGFTLRPTTVTVSLEAIETATPVSLQRGSRVGGTSMPGYCTGAFRFPELGRVRIATDCGRQAVVRQSFAFSPNQHTGVFGQLFGRWALTGDAQCADRTDVDTSPTQRAVFVGDRARIRYSDGAERAGLFAQPAAVAYILVDTQHEG